MNLKKEQSKKYMEEAELTIDAAQAIFDKAKEEDKDLWAHVIKCCYDAIEQAVSSAIAEKEEKIPIRHPEKINKFTELFDVPKELDEKISFWSGKRSSAQYIDIKNDKLSVPHELFDEEDAKKALEESKTVIDEIKKMIIEEETKSDEEATQKK